MEKKNKLRKILNLLSPDDTSEAFKAFDKEAAKLKEALKENIQAKTLEGVNLKLDRFRKSIDLSPLTTQVKNIELEFNNKIQAVSNLLDENSNNLKNLLSQSKDEGDTNLSKNISFVTSNIDSLKSQLKDLTTTRDTQIAELKTGINELKSLEGRFNKAIADLSQAVNTSKSEQTTSSEELKTKILAFDGVIKELRQDFLNRLSNIGGGNANRQINVKSSVMSSKYTDINFANSGGIVWTATDDNTNKRVNITASVIVSGSGGPGGSPGGNDTEVQFNDGGSFGGSSTLTWNKNTSILSAAAINVTGTSGLGYITLPNQSPNPPSVVAGNVRLHGFTTQGFTRLEQDNEAATNVILGRDLVTIARNTSGGDLARGDVVYITGSTGNVPNIAKAQANSSTTLPAVFVVVDPIVSGAFGQIMRNGILANFDTSAFSAGTPVWLSTTVAGGLTATRPSGLTNLVQRVGTILVSGVGNGSMDVSIAPAILNMETGTNAATWTGSSIVGTAALINGNLRIGGATSGTVTINTASVAGNWTLTLPPTDGSANQVLTTDGNGITTWASVAATGGSGITRTTSVITANTLADETASIDRVYIGTGLAFTLPDATGNTNRYTVKNTTASILVTAVGGDTIDGSASVLMALPNLSHDFISDNVNWNII